MSHEKNLLFSLTTFHNRIDEQKPQGANIREMHTWNENVTGKIEAVKFTLHSVANLKGTFEKQSEVNLPTENKRQIMRPA
ncbi:unnamed protein product [Litomosoides sigmodontis]|uniref:Uncharacterized protein n=1 Tax=Litomosoides sigmodontis TaxID=42156 RepID=A0A3P6T3B7_LITSI|nr:unnamed protein product [Litomosoides sigmodontis]